LRGIDRFKKGKYFIFGFIYIKKNNEYVYLKGIHALNPGWNKNITDKGLVHLKGVYVLDLGKPTTIMEDGSVVFDN
jgi:hypothetical protein